MKTDVFIQKLNEFNFVKVIDNLSGVIVINAEDSILADISKNSELSINTIYNAFKQLDILAKKKLSDLIWSYASTPILEREYATPFSVNPGDLVIESKPNSAHVYFVEGVDLNKDGEMESVLLVDGRKDKLFGREHEEESKQSVKESMDDFYREFKLIAKKENLEK